MHNELTVRRHPVPLFLLALLVLPSVLAPRIARASPGPQFEITDHRTRGEVRNCLFGDLNGDGFIDIVSISNVVSDANNTLTRWVNVFVGSASGKFPTAANQTFAVSDDAVVVDLGEVDPASRGVELVFATGDGVVYHSWQGGGLSETPRKLFDEQSIFQRVDESLAVSWDFVKDWNGDGVEDVLLPGFKKTALWTQDTKDPKKGWNRLQYLDMPLRTLWGSHWENDVIINRVSQLAVRGTIDVPDINYGDMTGDGIPDLTAVRFDWLSVFRGKGGGRFEESPVEIDMHLFTFTSILKYSRLQAVTRSFLVDFNRDGQLDVLATRLKITNLASFELGMETSVFFNHGGKFSKEPERRWVTGGFSETARTGDFNGDGYPDVAIQYFPFGITQLIRFFALGSLSIQYNYYYFDKAAGTFPQKPTLTDNWSFSFQSKQTNSSFGASYLFNNDFNGDGRRDFMQARGPDELTIALSSPSKYGADSYSYKVPCSFFTYATDLNHDTHDDIIIRYENMPSRNNVFTIMSSVTAELKPAK